MVRRIALLMISVIILFGLGQGLSSWEVLDKSTCHFKGHRLSGKIKFVESFPDITVEVVNTFPDVSVKLVEGFPHRCGEVEPKRILEDACNRGTIIHGLIEDY